ncbi:hypothetical protein N665_3100s0004 [Sinapis alba]|nr:hypothetical protein N665_3100s0004 [Sinapis alba]
MLVEENRQLSFQLQQQEMAIASNARGMMMRDQDGQFGYRAQPIHRLIIKICKLIPHLLSISRSLNLSL